MINVSIKKIGEDIVSVEVEGHAGYDVSGKDIVCSAVSAITQTALEGIEYFSKSKVKKEINEKRGYLKFVLPEPKEEQEKIQVQAIVKAMEIGLKDLESGFKSHLKVEVKL